MKVSDTGRRMIESFEGCVLHSYPDPVSGGEPWTIGYGHTAGVKPGQTITQAQADTLFANDLDRVYGPGVERALGGAPTTQPQFDAMVSLAYNVGVGAFSTSSVCRYHKSGDYRNAAASFARLNHAAGSVNAALTRRRATEAALYLSEGAAAPPADDPAPQPVADDITAFDQIKAIQVILRVKPDASFGPNSRAALNAILAAANQKGIV